MGPPVVRPRYLLDTNLLVYLHDGTEPAKQRRAHDVFARVGTEPSGALPAQALAEFASVALRKLKPPLEPDVLYTQVEALERAFPVLPLTPAVVLEAIRAVRDHGLSYYGAQVWAVAKLGQIPVLLSEDFDSGSTLEGVAFVNPFDPAFDVSQL
jgi:predicted nucleic acid-binding protein